MHRTYLTFNYPNSVPGSKTLLTGIRQKGDTFYITGFYVPPVGIGGVSFLYVGMICDICNICNYYPLDYPSSMGKTVTSTNLYGPSILGDDIQTVGNYFTVEKGPLAQGCLYRGSLDGSGKWITLTPTSDTISCIAHSCMDQLAVGNYDTNILTWRAFIYDIYDKTFTDITYPDAISVTAYGVWKNNKKWYTVCGGLILSTSTTYAYLLDYNVEAKQFANWRLYNYPNSTISHFNGISSDDNDGYYLVGDATVGTATVAFFAHVDACGSITWSNIKFPQSTGTSANSVSDSTVIGVYSADTSSEVNGYISIEC